MCLFSFFRYCLPEFMPITGPRSFGSVIYRFGLFSWLFFPSSCRFVNPGWTSLLITSPWNGDQTSGQFVAEATYGIPISSKSLDKYLSPVLPGSSFRRAVYSSCSKVSPFSSLYTVSLIRACYEGSINNRAFIPSSISLSVNSNTVRACLFA